MRRREFITLLGGLAGAAALPFAPGAQQRQPTVGILGSASALAMGSWVAAFVQRLRELGWTEALSGIRDYVEAGSLMSYGPNFADLFRRAAGLVDKILHAKPADLPVEQAAKFDLVLNLTTARVLGLKIPESFLLRADEVIE